MNFEDKFSCNFLQVQKANYYPCANIQNATGYAYKEWIISNQV